MKIAAWSGTEYLAIFDSVRNSHGPLNALNTYLLNLE